MDTPENLRLRAEWKRDAAARHWALGYDRQAKELTAAARVLDRQAIEMEAKSKCGRTAENDEVKSIPPFTLNAVAQRPGASAADRQLATP